MTDPREGLRERVSGILVAHGFDATQYPAMVEELCAPHLRAPLTDEEREAVRARMMHGTAASMRMYGGQEYVDRWHRGDRIIREHFGLTEGGEGEY